MKKIKVLKQVTSIFLSFVLIFSVFGMYSYAAEPYIKAKEGSDIKIWDDIKYITGLHPFMTKEDFLSEIESANCSLKVSSKGKYNSESDYIINGSKLELLDNTGGEVIDTYTLILYGAISGSEYYQSYDALVLSNLIKSATADTATTESKYIAADCNHDGFINYYDRDYIYSFATSYEYETYKYFQDKPYSELKTDPQYIEYCSKIDQSVKPNLNLKITGVKDGLKEKIEKYESTDLSNGGRAAAAIARDKYIGAVETYNDPEATQSNIDYYEGNLLKGINKSLAIKRYNNPVVIKPFVNEADVNSNPYYEWDKDLGTFTVHAYESSYNIYNSGRDIYGTITPWRSQNGNDYYVRDIILPDKVYIKDGIFSNLKALRSIRIYNENTQIGTGVFEKSTGVFGKSSVTVYGVCDNHKKLAEKYGFKYKSLYDYSFESEPSANLKIDSENKIISGIRNGITADDLSYFDINSSGCDVVPVENGRATVGTGTKFNVVKWIDGSVADTYTAVLFGDVDGDGKYDGADAYKVNLMVNGHLTKEQVGNEIWAAADCNHDGVIDASDVALLERAGLLLTKVDQSKTPEELKSDEAYIEYESLIDQSAEPNADIAAEPEAPKEPETESESNLVIFIKKIVSFIKEIISKILSLIK